MFRLLDRYVIREILPYFLIAFFLLTAIIFVREANRFSELFVVFSRRGMSRTPLLMLVISLLPSIMVFTLPIGFLLGVMMAMGRLSGDSEIIVMRAGGVSPLQLIRPVMIVAFIVTGLTAYNTFYLLPTAVNSLNQLKKTRSDLLLRSIETQIKPGTFTEDLPGKVLFIEKGADLGSWEHIFIAEESPDKTSQEPKIYMAEAGQLVLGKSLRDAELRLTQSRVYGLESREWNPKQNYNISSSGSATVSFSLGGKSDEGDSDLKPESPGPELLTFPELLKTQPARGKAKALAVETNKRLALPVACLIFAFFGVALGVTTLRSGKSSGLFLGTLVTLGFYLLFLGGERAARSGALPAALGIWLPNLVFLAIGLWIFFGGGAAVGRLPFAQALWRVWFRLTRPFINTIEIFVTKLGLRPRPAVQNDADHHAASSFGFPRIIDRMIMREATRHFLLVLGGLCGIFHIFTLFELINSIVQNRIGADVVVSYLLFLTPQIINYMVPFAVLVAVLVTFGLLGKTSQLIVLNSSGQSLYRLCLPVLLGASLLGGMLLVSQEYVLPSANRRQDYLRYQIKGGKLPAQTFYQSKRKWFRGRDNRMFNFSVFNPEKNEFVGLGIYELSQDESSLASRTYVNLARWDGLTNEWVLTNGWRRTFNADGTSSTAVPIVEERLKIAEGPDYFKQSVPELQKMSIRQLQEKIADLQSQGVDVESLRRALQTKIALPLGCIVMALVAIPFALTVGKRGAMVGVSAGVAIAVVFWGTIGIFEQLGNYQLLPSFWAAWGPNLLFSAGGIYLIFTSKT